MPLGILLAASWTGVLDPARIAREMRRSLDFLSGAPGHLADRQHSLRATFDYSWDLLDGAAQLAYARLSIFPGSFSAEYAERACGVSLAKLKALVDQSLLTAVAGGRFRMHDLLRQYAAEKLAALPEELAAVRQQFCQAYLDDLAAWSARLKSSTQAQALAEMDLEQANLALAWGLSLQHSQVSLPEESITGLQYYHLLRDRHDEGLSSCLGAENALEKLEDQDQAMRAVCSLRVWRANFLNHAGEEEQARQVIAPVVQALEEKARQAPGWNDLLARAYLVTARSLIYHDLLQALKFARQSLERISDRSDPWEISSTHFLLCMIYDLLSDRRACREHGLQALEYQKGLGDPYLLSQVKSKLSFYYMTTGDYPQALQLVAELAEYYRQLGGPYALAESQVIQATMLYWAGQRAEASAAIQQGLPGLEKLGLMPEKNFLDLLSCEIAAANRQYDSAVAFAQRMMQPGTCGMYLLIIGLVELARGNMEQAEQTLNQSLIELLRHPRKDFVASPLVHLGLIAYRRGDAQKARALLVEGLEVATCYPTISVCASCLAVLAWMLADQGQDEAAVELYAAASAHPFMQSCAYFCDTFGGRMEEAAAALPPTVAAAARQRGSQQDPFNLAEHWLEKIQRENFLV